MAKSIDGISLKKKTTTNTASIDGIAKKITLSTTGKTAPIAKKIAPTPVAKDFTPSPKKVAAKPKKSVITVEEFIDEKNPVDDETLTPKAVATDFLSPVGSADFLDNNTEEESLEDVINPKKKAKKEKQKKENLSFDEIEIDGEKVKYKKKKKKISPLRWMITSVLLFIVLVVLGGLIYLFTWGNDIIAKITGGQSDIWGALGALMSDEYVELKTDAQGRTNILAFGTSGYNMDGDEGNGTHAGAQLTDSIMVISLNQKTGDVAMISLPRDLKASPTCTATGKINEVYWCNNMRGDNESAGAQALMNEVGSILGVDFQYYVHINWGSLITIVDTLGGITVTLDEDIEDYYYTKTNIKAGVPTTLNGEQALGLARARHGTSSGDFSRGMSQQKILIAIKDKIYEKDFSLGDTITLLNTLGDNLRSNVSIDEYKSAIHLTYEFDFDSMRNVTLLNWSLGIHYMKTANINGISYVIPYAGEGNYADIRKYVAKMFSNNPLDYEEASISILNATNRSGLAGKESDKLTERGYTVRNVANAPEEFQQNEEYTVYEITSGYPGTKKMLEAQYGTVKSAGELPAIIDTAGCDFVIILGGEEETEE